MATERLVVPEEHLAEVIRVIRTGVHHTRPLKREVRLELLRWCDDEEQYLRDLEEDD